MDATQVEQAVARLSAKLEALDLDQDERAVLEAICTAGAVAVEGAEGEVEGFAFDASAPGPAGHLSTAPPSIMRSGSASGSPPGGPSQDRCS